MKFIGSLFQLLGKSLRNSLHIIVLLLFVASFTLNIVMFAGSAAYSAASSAFHAVTGITTVAMRHADEVADLGGQLAKERAAKKKVRSKLAQVTEDLTTEQAAKRKLRVEMGDLAENLAIERATSRKLRTELRDAAPGVVLFRGRKVAIKEAVDTTANRISRRAATTSTRELGSMAGEAIPYLGIAVVVGATALELKDLCDTLKDMSELQRAFDPNAGVSDEQKTVCAQRVPTRAELWEMAKTSPGHAWEGLPIASDWVGMDEVDEERRDDYAEARRIEQTRGSRERQAMFEAAIAAGAVEARDN